MSPTDNAICWETFPVKLKYLFPKPLFSNYCKSLCAYMQLSCIKDNNSTPLPKYYLNILLIPNPKHPFELNQLFK